MSKKVELGAKLEYVKVTGTCANRHQTGVKVSPDTCKFLNNFILTGVEAKVVSGLDFALQCAEVEKLKDWMVEPDNDYGVQFTFNGILYGKPVMMLLTHGDDTDYNNPLSTNWLDALNIIIEAFYYQTYDNEADEYTDLPEFHDYNGIAALDFDILVRTLRESGIEEALKSYSSFTRLYNSGELEDMSAKELLELIAKSEQPITIEDYMKSVELEDDEVVQITISRDCVVYMPEIIKGEDITK